MVHKNHLCLLDVKTQFVVEIHNGLRIPINIRTSHSAAQHTSTKPGQLLKLFVPGICFAQLAKLSNFISRKRFGYVLASASASHTNPHFAILRPPFTLRISPIFLIAPSACMSRSARLTAERDRPVSDCRSNAVVQFFPRASTICALVTPAGWGTRLPLLESRRDRCDVGRGGGDKGLLYAGFHHVWIEVISKTTLRRLPRRT